MSCMDLTRPVFRLQLEANASKLHFRVVFPPCVTLKLLASQHGRPHHPTGIGFSRSRFSRIGGRIKVQIRLWARACVTGAETVLVRYLLTIRRCTCTVLVQFLKFPGERNKRIQENDLGRGRFGKSYRRNWDLMLLGFVMDAPIPEIPLGHDALAGF